MDISEIYQNYYTYIYNYALKLTCHPDDAADVTQETFIKAMEKLDKLQSNNALAKWLRTICFHEFINKARKDKDKYLVETEDWTMLENEGKLLTSITVEPEEEIVVDEEIRDMQNGCFLAMVRKLTLNQRIIFSLVDMYGIDIENAAGILNITKGAAKGLLYRARMNIDSFFADHCSILNEENPCSCRAWITFSKNRENLQKSTKRIIKKLDFTEKEYVYDEDVRKKIAYLYSTMPEKKPSDEWYKSVLEVINLQKNNQKNF